DAAKGKRYALLVGVKSYKHDSLPDLKYAENDAEQMAKALARFDEVVVLTSSRSDKDDKAKPTAANVRAQLKRLLDKAGKDDSVLIGFAGHGLQKTATDPKTKKDRDESFFCPSDARPRDTKDLAELSKTMLPLGELFRELEDSGVGVKLLLVDACRD